MTDRITSLQDSINNLADQMANGIGVLQMNAGPCPLGEITEFIKEENLSEVYASDIAFTSKIIDNLIESLPSTENNDDRTVRELAKINVQREQATAKLKKEINEAGKLLKILNEALEDISRVQIEARPRV
uniref:Mediator of RNA polymerase II transcription subunit 21 n=1 Tax=Parastrongyloides trichosuri TaxID=131310 RepID=A0A0N4ZVM3_PARTI